MNPMGIELLISFQYFKKQIFWDKRKAVLLSISLELYCLSTLQFILLKLTNISAEIKGFKHQKFTLLSKTYILHTSHRINTNDFNAPTLSAKDKIKYENEMIIFRRWTYGLID